MTSKEKHYKKVRRKLLAPPFRIGRWKFLTTITQTFGP
jgi:hypothetical protein